jgi:hypothetical protein
MPGSCTLSSILVVNEPPASEHQTYGLPCYFYAGVVVLYESSLKAATDPTNWSDVLIFTTGGAVPQPGGPALTATYVSDTESAAGQSNGITDADLAAAGLPTLHVSDLNQPNTVYLREDWTSFDNYYDAQGPDGHLNRYDLLSEPVESDFQILGAPNSVTLDQGASGTWTITPFSIAGAPQTIILSTSGLPTGATAGFSPASVTSNSSSILTISAGTAAPGNYTLTITGMGLTPTGGIGATHSTNVSLAITAPVPTLPKTWGGLKGLYHR